MSYTLQITDGTTTIDLNDTSSYCQIFGDWSPAVAEKNSAGLGGQPYLPVTEQMTLTISGTSASDVLSKAEAIRAMLEQAQRWHDGENVSPVIVKYAPYSGATTWQSPIHGGNLGMPGTFTNVDTNHILEPVTLSFVRDGAWYGDEEAAVVNLLTNGDFEGGSTSPWSKPSAVTLSVTTSVVHGGNYALNALMTASSQAFVRLYSADRVAVAAGTQYTLSGWYRADNTTPFRMDMRWFDSGGAQISSDTTAYTAVSAVDTWEERTLTATSPTGAATCEIRAMDTGGNSPASGDNFWLDDLRFYADTGGSTTSSTNPAVLSLDFDSTLTTPAPVDFDIELSSTSIGDTYGNGEMAVVVGNSTTDMQIDTTTNTTTTATATAEHDYMTVPAARRLGVYAVVKGEDWKLTLMGDTRTFISYPAPIPVQASSVYVSSSAWQLVHLGEIALPQGGAFGHIGISVERVNATSDLTIAAVLIYDADACLAAQNNDAFEPYGYAYYFTYKQSILTYAEPNTAAGFIGARHFWLDGNQLVVGVIGQSGGYSNITKPTYGITASVTLKNAKRRKAVLIPQ